MTAPASRALIGHTGFVGGNLRGQGVFEHLFNSSNIEDIRGRSFDLVVCAGAPSVKWRANQEPEADLVAVSRLIGALREVEARRVVVISTVDVYPTPVDVDEDTPIDRSAGLPYGRHRLMLEDAVRERFDTTVVRLPGLFGPGLKKNIIYDLLHGNQVDRIAPDSQFQFYDLTGLTRDIDRVITNGIELVNLATEPVSVADVARYGFGLSFENPDAPLAASYDIRTKFDGPRGGRNGYLQDRHEVLDRIRTFVLHHQRQPPGNQP